jgi:hypothetical protein
MIKRIILISLLLLLWIIPSIASADSGIVILDETVELDFPQKIIFHLGANSDVDIVDARLHYQVIKRNYAQVVGEGWPDFIPADSIKTSWVWDMRKSSLPPGVAIIYWWTVEGADGEFIQTTPLELNYDDLRYDWQSLNEGQIILYWYEGDDSFARELMEACQQGVLRLSREIGAFPEKLIKIYIYGSANDLRGAMIYPQEWTGGAAFTEFDTIVIGISSDNFHWGTEALVHELTHLVVYQAVFSPYGKLPTWLDEGLAMYNEGALSASFQSRLDEAVVADGLISVRSLCSSFPADPDGAYLAYAESYSIVEYLLTNYGQDKMLDLLTLFKEGSTYDEALEQFYGFTIAGLDTQWRQVLSKPVIQSRKPGMHPGLIAVISALATSLVLAAALALEERDWRRFCA